MQHGVLSYQGTNAHHIITCFNQIKVGVDTTQPFDQCKLVFRYNFQLFLAATRGVLKKKKSV
jgi:hypothetical protein